MNKKQKNKKGISLIVLVIAVIVMIILAGTVIVSISNNGIIDKAEEAVEKANLKQVEQAASLAWAELYADGIKTPLILETKVNEKLKESGVSINKYNVIVTTNGVTVEPKTLELNQYGFYFNAEYILEGTIAITGDICNTSVVFTSDEIYISNVITSKTFNEGEFLAMADFGGTRFATTYSLEYNKIYSGTGTLGAQCQCFIGKNGRYYDVQKIPEQSIAYSSKEVNLGNAIIVEFTADGKNFDFNGQTFTLAK